MLWGAIFFACMGILTHVLRETFPWQTIALVRTSLALVIATLLTWSEGSTFVFFKPPTLWIRSLSGSCSLVLTFYALTHAHSLAEVLVLTNMFPVWVALLSWPVLGTFPRWDAWLAIGVGLVGVIVIQRPGIAPLDSALLAAAGASFTTSAAMLGLHRLKHLDPSAIVTHFSAVSVLFCLATMLLFPLASVGSGTSSDEVWTGRNVLLLIGVGATATAGQLFLTKAFAAGVPAKVSVVGLSQVCFTAIADSLLWQRRLEWHTLIGMALIIAPTIWLLTRSGAPKEPPPLE